MYRTCSRRARLGTATCYGAVVDPARDRYWLFLEQVPGRSCTRSATDVWQRRPAGWRAARRASRAEPCGLARSRSPAALRRRPSTGRWPRARLGSCAADGRAASARPAGRAATSRSSSAWPRCRRRSSTASSTPPTSWCSDRQRAARLPGRLGDGGGRAGPDRPGRPDPGAGRRAERTRWRRRLPRRAAAPAAGWALAAEFPTALDSAGCTWPCSGSAGPRTGRRPPNTRHDWLGEAPRAGRAAGPVTRMIPDRMQSDGRILIVNADDFGPAGRQPRHHRGPRARHRRPAPA